ncbi:ECF RNA polymerase sigma factor SigW [Poriferisphaera corsica]|uniref:ECF RNA polymerase sigma factor SigW n=1 Tax=Poriferisphaera corsica TaxID=2528020 RepID=A0A517YQ30_9BACT|nr:sigma-70 family RNA polymerase sigma factor [Poriferisphaera corsica]QDU32320.1 ECF RNA polymerase sigma factor SigW [Poriferisphaera corsica]
MAEHTSQSPADQHAQDLMLRQAAAGDGAAWASLVRNYSPRVFGLIFKQCRDKELAEEITQDTFVTIAQKLLDNQGYEERGRFESWLFLIATNRLRDEMRRRKRQARPTDMSPAASSRQDDGSMSNGISAPTWAGDESQLINLKPLKSQRPEDKLIRDEQIQRLKAAVEQLNEADQEIVYLRHTAGLSFAQIAEMQEKPIGTVLARSHRAIKKLRQLLDSPDD